MRHHTIARFLAPAVAVACAVPAVASAKALTLSPVDFSSNGDTIAGWQWLRRPGQTATWTFDASALPSASRASAHLNMTALVTQTVSGGSGYDADVKFRVGGVGAGPVAGGTAVVNLVNPFRPIDPDDSGGIGYQAYGHSSGLPRLPASGQVTATMAYPFSPRGRHVAVRRDSLSIGYSVRVVAAPRR